MGGESTAAGLGVDADGPQAFAEPGRVMGRPGRCPGTARWWQAGSRLRCSCSPANQLKDGVGERAGDGHVVAPRRMNVSPSRRVTWLMVMAAMRDSS